MEAMANYEHLLKAYDVRDQLDEIASADPQSNSSRTGRRPMDELRQGPRLVPGAALGAALLAALAGCRTPVPPPPAAAEPPLQEAGDSSYDWHGLLIAPFGSALKEVPATLHEVLLFHDAARGATPDEDAECYATDTSAPRFVGHAPDEYLLCFKRDRLARVQASVRLAEAEASEVFAAACARWLRTAAAPGADKPEAPPPASLPNGAAPDGDVCEGRQGEIRFSGRLQQPGPQEAPAEEIPLTITLDSVPESLTQ
jgi:hypothetical protein